MIGNDICILAMAYLLGSVPFAYIFQPKPGHSAPKRPRQRRPLRTAPWRPRRWLPCGLSRAISCQT